MHKVRTPSVSPKTGKTNEKLGNTCTCVLKLNLQVHKTGHRAVQVDGESQLPVLGDVHTTFTRGTTTLHCSGLDVSRLGWETHNHRNVEQENG